MESASGPPVTLPASSPVSWEGMRMVVDDPQRRVVILLEHPDFSDRLLPFIRTFRARITLVATSPGASWECERSGIPWVPVEKYYDADSVFALGMGNYERVEQLCREIDGALHSHIPALRDYNFRPALDSFFPIKMLHDALTIRTTILTKIIEAERPDLIVTFCPYPSPGRNDRWEFLPFGYYEGMYAPVLSHGEWGVPWAGLEVEQDGLGSGIRATLTRIFRPLVNGWNLIRPLKRFLTLPSLKRQVISLVENLKSRFSSRDSVLMVGYGYDWACMAPSLWDAGFGIVHLWWSGKNNRGGDMHPLPSLAGPVGRAGIFMGVDMTPLLLQHLEGILGRYLQSIPEVISRFEGPFREKPPVAVLFGTKSSASDHILARLAQHYLIPVISWQHGAQGTSYVPMMMYYEVMNSDLHLCFGEGVKELYGREANEKFHCRMLPVGSCEVQRLSLDPSPAEPQYELLYATTNYYLNYLYIGGLSHTTFQDNDLWQTQRRILDVMGRSGKKCAFKLHPGQYQEKHLREYITGKGYTNIRVFKNERDFTDLALHSEAIILDCPSTTLIQATATKKPIFLLTRHVHLTEPARSLVEKRAYCSDNVEDLLTRIGHHLKGGNTRGVPDVENTEFLEQYGLYQRDGRVAERALSVLRALGARHGAERVAEETIF